MPGRPGACADRRRRTRQRRERRRNRDERDAALVGVEEARGPRRRPVLADAGVHDAGLIERAAGLPHAFEPPVGGVVVRARHDVEPDRLEILGHGRRADDPDAAELGLRHRRRAREIDARCPSKLPNADVGVVDDLADRARTPASARRAGR